MLFRSSFRIDSKEKLAEAIEKFKILPFFPNNIWGLSVEEMCAPGMLFGGNYEEGCWEWKGQIIRMRTSGYGKIFRRKAGFISLELLPDFLNYRRAKYPVKIGSTEEMLLDIIKQNDSLTSTELKKYIFGDKKSREWNDLPDRAEYQEQKKTSKSIEGPLQRLQMGGWILISDFEYKTTKRGERYGWGVARYSTPETIFGNQIIEKTRRTPEESLDHIVSIMKKKWTITTRASSWKELLY